MRPIYHRLRNRIEGYICICFTAYTIMLELERILKATKSEIAIYKAKELIKNMYVPKVKAGQTGLSWNG